MRRNWRNTETMSLDSFLDVVCNLVAGLLLIALTTALGTSKQVFEVLVPVEQQTRAAQPVSFVTTEAGIYPIDAAAAEAQLTENQQSGDKFVAAETEYFQWAVSPDDFVMVSRLKDTPPPITEENLQRVVELLDGEGETDSNCFAYFYVTPNDEAFRLFRLARKRLWEKDYQVGWMPAMPRERLVFGKGGRAVQPQN